MATIEHRYFRKGVDNQKKADCTFIMKRLNPKDVMKLSLTQRIGLLQWLKDCEVSFSTYKKVLRTAAKKF